MAQGQAQGKENDIWAEAKRLWARGYTLDEIVSIIKNDYGKNISRSTIYYKSKKESWENRIREYKRQEKQKQLKEIMKKLRCSRASAYKYLAVREHTKDIKMGKHGKSIDHNYTKMKNRQHQDLLEYFKGKNNK
jgi:predicted DNA-binding transcriptional regulator AlpA